MFLIQNYTFLLTAYSHAPLSPAYSVIKPYINSNFSDLLEPGADLMILTLKSKDKLTNVSTTSKHPQVTTTRSAYTGVFS